MTVVAGFAFAACAAPAAAAPYAGIVMDAKTGKVLYESHADSKRFPASLTKMMTLYLTFEALESGRIKLSDRITVSRHAAAQPPSKLGVRAGGSLTVEQAMLSLVTRSANDMATALGEYVGGGSEAHFAQLMTAKAHSLGMRNTTYRNANGLPNKAQMTTAHDQALLGIALRQHFPQYYHYFNTRVFKFGKQRIGNHNRLLGKVRGVDGIKTGYTHASGFNLATSAEYGGRSVVGVVLGGKTGRSRDAQMKKLIASYMPKASRGPQRFTIARTPGAANVNVPVASLPAVGPMPIPRYDNGAVASTNAALAYADGSAGTATAAVNALAARVPSAEVPVPAPAPAFLPGGSSAAELAATDSIKTGSIKPSSGWIVQVGTSPSRDGAEELLRHAQNKGGKVLRSASPFAVAYNTGSGDVYRARFGGFDNQNDAVDACKSLKRHGVGCWAAPL
ncbi:D-alanyl-D-alanine carboxypeptidase [Rhizobium halophytocola]|uniref:D-alanyl-D-alanine carboxypeptidase n=1 Tax=Rhizobium halophytocola TaxID=735519 RepID=A0ABS4DWE6_9HYPH|nr:SPOR domain-containing protein [Rhizobium halophytocola]MBP1849964.1 D-alanyl-D-alanine carboxypeptidase [Rhizobium halophytocola]